MNDPVRSAAIANVRRIAVARGVKPSEASIAVDERVAVLERLAEMVDPGLPAVDTDDMEKAIVAEQRVLSLQNCCRQCAA